jgi:diadenosine tetraphosphatase ApaH/serine/threonine PP2A family protein phosphatase
MDSKLRTIIVGDIHGCIDELNELIKTLSYDKKTDRLILLGDLIDRGPDSVGVVQRARELDLECVMGNHDYKFLKWWKNSGSNADFYDRHPHYTKFSDADVNYISRMSPYIKLEEHNTVVVHAGLRAGISLANQKKDDLYYLRYIDSNADFISLKKISKLGKEVTDAHFWTEFWKGPESIVYGHNVHSYESPLIEEVSTGVNCYGIDTGCCFGGKLTALIMETKEIVQVKAKQTYYKSDFNIK